MWVFPKVTLTELEKRMVVATVIQIGVEKLFSTHMYTFGGKFFLQQSGGPIGLRGTCAAARVVMSRWDKKWLERLEAANITLALGCRYMDDRRAVFHPI